MYTSLTPRDLIFGSKAPAPSGIHGNFPTSATSYASAISDPASFLSGNMTDSLASFNPQAFSSQLGSLTNDINSTYNINGINGLVGDALGNVSGPKLGLNFDTGKLALAGLQTIGNLWAAFQANKLAKQQFQFNKEFANANMANQIKSYNTALADRSRSRAFTEGQSQEAAQAYIDANKLTRDPIGG